MSNEIAIKDDKELVATVKASLYPDASDNAIRLVIAYCKNQQIDIFSKALHIVKYGDAETIVPGIGLARIKAFRTGEYVGLSDVIFGPTIKGKLGNTEITYPEYATCTAKRKIGNVVAEFTSTERFVECYGTLKDKASPTIFWLRRPFAQLAKTVESSVLKKAFPESVSSQPNFEELQTHTFEEALPIRSNPQVAVDKTADEIKSKFITLTADESGDQIDTETGEVIENPSLKAELVEELRLLLQSKGIPAETYNQWKEQASVKSFTEMTIAALRVLIDNINNGVL